MYLRVNRNYTPCRVYDIEWVGTSFTAQVDVPNFRQLSLSGSIDGDDFSAELRISDERSIEIVGVEAGARKRALQATSGR